MFLVQKNPPKPGKKQTDIFPNGRLYNFGVYIFPLRGKVKYILKVDCYFQDTEIWQKQKSYFLTREWKIPNFFLKAVFSEQTVYFVKKII